jgi:hypothetical protein
MEPEPEAFAGVGKRTCSVCRLPLHPKTEQSRDSFRCRHEQCAYRKPYFPGAKLRFGQCSPHEGFAQTDLVHLHRDLDRSRTFAAPKGATMTEAIVLGDITIHPVIEQQGAWFEAMGFLPALIKERLDENRAWLEPAFLDSAGKLVLCIQSFVIKTPHQESDSLRRIPEEGRVRQCNYASILPTG